MDPVLAGFLGGVLGAALTGIAGILTAVFTTNRAKKLAVDDARLSLVREIMRFRGDQDQLSSALNEVPILFGEDDVIMSSFRALLKNPPTEMRNRALKDMLNRLARLTKMPGRLLPDDIEGYLFHRT